MYDQVITVCNKLKKADTVSKISDEWVKTVVYNAEHRTQVNKTVVGSVVNMGQSQTVLIPFVGNNHLPYIDWAKSPQSGFTMSQGDVIFFGELTDDVTSQNIASLKVKYSPDVCEVRSVTQARDNGIATVKLKIDGV